jgi:uncharacterized membrane protein
MRFSSIDILRTVAIVLMVLVHFMENLSGKTNWSPTGFGAPFFAFLAGVSYSLWLKSKGNRSRSEEELSKITIRRGLFLIGLGFLFNIVIWLPEDVFNWDVLTYIGSSILVLNWVRRGPPAVALILAGMLCLASPILQKQAQYDLYWTDGYFQVDWTLSDILIGYLITGYFPLFPWLALPLVGFACGNFMLDSKTLRVAEVRTVAITGVALLAISVLLQLAHPYMPSQLVVKPDDAWTMFPPSLAYLAGTIGMVLFWLAILHRWIDHNPKMNPDRGLLSVASTLSRHSLTIYILHHVVHLWPLWLFAIWQGQEATFYWNKAFSIYYSVPLALLFVVLCYFFLRWMDRTGKPGVEHWMRWLCD